MSYKKDVDALDVAEGGNTKRPPLRNRYCLTLNNYSEEEYKSLLDVCNELCKTYIIGKEIGENGTPHLQCYINLKKQLRFKQVKQWNQRLHIEPARGSEIENLKYCGKERDYESNKRVPRELLKVQYDHLKEYQKDFICKYFSFLCKNDCRKIIWAYEKYGAWGKTFISKYLVDSHILSALVVPPKTNDALYLIAKYVEQHGEAPDIIIIDIPRSVCDDFVNYTLIEKIKDGIFAVGKYDSVMLRINTPHVLVLTNTEPMEEELSADRWEIIDLSSAFPPK